MEGQQLIGTVLGTCTLQRLIGAGGMGVVYLARQARPSRDVAVKVLRPAMSAQEAERQEFLARFRREADVIARLDHVNIMPIYEYGEQYGFAYLVMPYLTGGSLRDKLLIRGALPLQETLSYIEQAASALDYAHAHKIVHRDIKPGNFLFHADGRLVLADFGIARILRDNTGTINETTLTSAGGFLGSPEYMAPEMVHGEYVDQRTDIYELGIVLFQMLSGRVPFQGNSPYVVAVKHLQEPPPLLHQMNLAIPPAVDAVVRKAIAKRREERYMSAGELAKALRAAIVAPSHTPWDTVPEVPTTHSLPQSTPLPAVAVNYVPVQPATPVAPQSYNSSNALQGPQPSAPGRTPWLMIIGVLVIVGLTVGALFAVPQFLKGTSPQANGTPIVQSTSAAPTPTATTPAPTPTATPTPAITPSQQAQNTVQQYYADINQSDYQDAYQLWGSAYQSTQSYDQFANGFATTKHDDIVLHTITPLADGTVKVEMTLYATQQNSSVNTYEGTYTVGVENGRWKLLTANFKQVS